MSTGIADSRDLAAAVAYDAIDQLAAAVDTINQLEALLKAARPGVGLHTDAARLLDLGVYAAMDQANGFDCMRETLLERLTGSAPQKPTSPKRGAGNPDRLSLADFSKGRQHEAARDLGVQQAAISKAIRVGRNIFVTRQADGSYRATEEKPFPSPRFGGAV